jgi:arsenate reductase
MQMAVTLYGLVNCDTTRAARKWLDAAGVTYRFCDVRADGLSQTQVKAWVEALGWEKVLNRASTTWRSLPDADKQDMDAKRAVARILEHPALLKRPMLEGAGEPLPGFKAEIYAARFG